MSKDLGSQLPDDLLKFLSSGTPPSKFNTVVVFTSMDEDGWPRHGLLSLRELVAKGPARLLLLLYSESGSTANLLRDGRTSLLLVNENMSCYVRCSARPLPSLSEAPGETLFELTVERVQEDKIPTARILSGVTFEGNDPGMTTEGRILVHQKLLAM